MKIRNFFLTQLSQKYNLVLILVCSFIETAARLAQLVITEEKVLPFNQICKRLDLRVARMTTVKMAARL
jgi:hypothetical protein